MRTQYVTSLALLLVPICAPGLCAPASNQSDSTKSTATTGTSAASASPAASTIAPAMLNLGGLDVFSIHSSSGGLTPQQRVDQITSRLTPLLGVPSIPATAVRIYAPASGNPSIYVFGRRIVTIDQQTASSEGNAKPIDLAKQWAAKLQNILPQVNYRAQGQPEPTLSAHPKLIVTDKLDEVGGGIGEVKLNKKVVVRLRGAVQGLTAAERSDAIRIRLYRALQKSNTATSETTDIALPNFGKTGGAPAVDNGATQAAGPGATAGTTASSSSQAGSAASQPAASMSPTAATSATSSAKPASGAAAQPTTGAAAPVNGPKPSATDTAGTVAAVDTGGPAITVEPVVAAKPAQAAAAQNGKNAPAGPQTTTSAAKLVINGSTVVTVDQAEAKAAGQPNPAALAQAWAKNIKDALAPSALPAAPTTTPSAEIAAPSAAAPTNPATPAQNTPSIPAPPAGTSPSTPSPEQPGSNNSGSSPANPPSSSSSSPSSTSPSTSTTTPS